MGSLPAFDGEITKNRLVCTRPQNQKLPLVSLVLDIFDFYPLDMPRGFRFYYISQHIRLDHGYLHRYNGTLTAIRSREAVVRLNTPYYRGSQ